MSERFLKGSCQHCGGRIEYPAAAVGTPAPCPHCRQETELVLDEPPSLEEVPRRKWFLWVLIGLVALGMAGFLAPVLLKRAAEKHRRDSLPPRP